ncbi:MAG: NAD-dependent epimerase/dehydratase family protein [Verrucomicrobia bacterium]|nr:MAG: NAD-dependent epimerase/dehydratase family protein [Verrucomicrobiota bacterium]
MASLLHVLFLGGTGNISTSAVELLAARGHRISVLTRGKQPVPAGAHSLVADRHDEAALRRAIGDDWPDVVINFIGYTLEDVALDHALLAGRVRQYIFISTAMVYAKPHRHVPLTEDGPRGNPFSSYAQKKHTCEDWLWEKWRAEKFPVTIVRPSHTYGPHWIPNPVRSSSYTPIARLEHRQPIFVHNDGQGLWTLTAASDFAVGLAGLVGRDDALGEAFHITSDEVLTWNQIYAEVIRAAGVCDPKILKIPAEFICQICPPMTERLPADKAEPGVFDNAKIKRFVPEFECRKNFRAGIAESVAWFRADPARQALDPETDGIFSAVCAAWQAWSN